ARNPVVIGDPSKGTPVTTLNDGKGKVQITTTGISITDGDEDQDDKEEVDAAGTVTRDSNGTHVSVSSSSEDWQDTLVPIAFFLFLLSVILGARYISSRNEQRRLELLKLMVEKGQPVPEGVVNQILTPKAGQEAFGEAQVYKRTRNTYAFTAAGI